MRGLECQDKEITLTLTDVQPHQRSWAGPWHTQMAMPESVRVCVEDGRREPHVTLLKYNNAFNMKEFLTRKLYYCKELGEKRGVRSRILYLRIYDHP